jgi:hypothetical protein
MNVTDTNIDVKVVNDICTSSRSARTEKLFEITSRPATIIGTRREATGGSAARDNPAALGVADWLCLAATPTFAIMALLAGVLRGGSLNVLCTAADAASPLSGMVPMYLLMSAFHSAPWLKLISSRRRGVVAVIGEST